MTTLTEIVTGMEKGPEAIDTNFKAHDASITALTNLATVTKMVEHTDGITFKNGAIGSGAHYSIGTYGKLRILTFDAGVKGVNIDGSGTATFASIPTSAYAGTKPIATLGDVHHNGMGGYVMILPNTDTGDIMVTAIDGGNGRGLASDLTWSASVTVLMEVA